MWYSDDKRVVMYPCNDNELLNFVCIHPETESQGSSEEWNKDATVDQVLKVYHGFDPRLLSVIKKADPDSIKVWKLLDMEILPTWINGKLGLLGDAAHPFLPRKLEVIQTYICSNKYRSRTRWRGCVGRCYCICSGISTRLDTGGGPREVEALRKDSVPTCQCHPRILSTGRSRLCKWKTSSR